MEMDINKTFSEYFLNMNGKQIPINAIGILKGDKGDEFVVLTNMEGIVHEDEYVIVELLRSEERIEFVMVADEDYYNKLCDLWELHLERLEASVIDS